MEARRVRRMIRVYTLTLYGGAPRQAPGTRLYVEAHRPAAFGVNAALVAGLCVDPRRTGTDQEAETRPPAGP